MTIVEDNNNKNPLLGKIEQKAKAMIKSDKMREPQNSTEYITKNTMRLLEKTYTFMIIILAMFIAVAIFRESIVEVILPLFTLIIGGVFGLMANNLLGNRNSGIPPTAPSKE